MPANLPTWTDERIALLRNHFEAGLSCREIAAQIGVTRNAVIGKLARLNLRRESNQDGSGAPRRRKSRKKGELRGSPRQQYRLLQALYADPQPSMTEPIHNERCCSLLELDEQRCRWPISSPGQSDFRFCGNVPIGGLPYCPGHARIAYRPDHRQRATRG